MKHETRNKIIVGVVAAFGLVFFVWLGSFDRVRDIAKAPAIYRGTTVRLFGRIGPVHAVPFEGSLYKLGGSGDIWIVSENDATTQGGLIYVEAVVHIGKDAKALYASDKFKKLFDDEAAESTPSIILEETDRGGFLQSFRAIRTPK